VEHSGGFGVVSGREFGQDFMGRVANHEEILLFYRRRKAAARPVTGLAAGAKAAAGAGARAAVEEVLTAVPLPEAGAGGAVDIATLLAEEFSREETNPSVLALSRMNFALQQ